MKSVEQYRVEIRRLRADGLAISLAELAEDLLERIELRRGQVGRLQEQLRAKHNMRLVSWEIGNTTCTEGVLTFRCTDPGCHGTTKRLATKAEHDWIRASNEDEPDVAGQMPESMNHVVTVE